MPSTRATFPQGCPWLLAVAMGAGLVLSASAQGDRGSLTDQFPKLSAKERARIADKEAAEAGKDVDYQDLMRAAEKAFQEGRYEEALAGYEKARAQRPYNIYPKVKIEDLHALIARQAQANKPARDTSASVSSVETVQTEEPVEKVVPTVTKAATNAAPREVNHPKSEAAVAVPVETVEPLRAAEGIMERRYREGRAYVIERVVTVDGGRLVKYKRVFHPTGQVFYFEDGSSVDERVWKARFPDP